MVSQNAENFIDENKNKNAHFIPYPKELLQVS